jgi:hypothetical protein
MELIRTATRQSAGRAFTCTVEQTHRTNRFKQSAKIDGAEVLGKSPMVSKFSTSTLMRNGVSKREWLKGRKGCYPGSSLPVSAQWQKGNHRETEIRQHAFIDLA